MFHSSKVWREYTPVEDSETLGDAEVDESRLFCPKRNPKPHSRWRHCIPIVAMAVLCLVLGAFSATILYSKQSQNTIYPSKSLCKNPAMRQEWRSLGNDEKQEYIRAVQCLKETPSRLGLNQTLYDDFPYIHSAIGGDVHETASFLSWHRYYIHIYEQALREQCSYTHHLPYIISYQKIQTSQTTNRNRSYWDWSLDWLDLTSAPIWSSTLGFGTDGNTTDLESIHGHCVTDGPFARLEVLYVEKYPYPHCLSREFMRGEALQNASQALRPAALHELLKIDDYETFNLAVEDGVHLVIPAFVHGDFATFTAPADPVFFLHHAQLDRLWWRWQQIDPPSRVSQPSGEGIEHNGEGKAYLRDILAYGGMAPDVRVEDIVSTESDVLCYRY